MCRNLPSLQDLGKFKAWLYKIAMNYCREEIRRRQTNRSTPVDKVWNVESEQSPRWEMSRNRTDDPDRQYQRNEVADILHAALMAINEDQRAVVIMKEYEGLKFREIAEVLNISENTVKSRMYYGLESLKRILEKQNINKDTINYEL